MGGGGGRRPLSGESRETKKVWEITSTDFHHISCNMHAMRELHVVCQKIQPATSIINLQIFKILGLRPRMPPTRTYFGQEKRDKVQGIVRRKGK